jgi:putative ABC transport system ATP-binding protein
MLSVEDVVKSYAEPSGGRIQVLNVPRLQVAAGEQVVLVGPSGCGKTTLLHVIAGIITPDSGRVIINGRDITRLSEAGRDAFRAGTIGYVFQTFNLLPGLTALENVRLGMTFARGRHDLDRALALLDRVGLRERFHYRPDQLSVGQQQRVAIARALAARPKLLLADEPTANVDTGNQQRIIDLIRQFCDEEQVALLLVTHAPEVARQFARVEHLEEINRAARSSNEAAVAGA